ncbi:unnamed protein product, partial [Allacma fusca]
GTGKMTQFHLNLSQFGQSLRNLTDTCSQWYHAQDLAS